MKIILAITVISCFLATAIAQDGVQCSQELANLASCVTRLGSVATGSPDSTFCSACGNRLISYYEDCTSAADILALGQCEFGTVTMYAYYCHTKLTGQHLINYTTTQ